MPVTQNVFGTFNDGLNSKQIVKSFTISNNNIELQVMNYGVTIISIKVPDKLGLCEDIVLGFDDFSSYVNHPYYFGCTVGRVANRIKDGIFSSKNQNYTLNLNNNGHHLHGGLKGFDKIIWDSNIISDESVVFSYTSPSGEEGYPGDLQCSITFEICGEHDIIIRYRATATDTTPVNLTNHSYFNLAGHGSPNINDHVISLNADHYTPVHSDMIPTGEIAPVENTPFDLRTPKKMEDLFGLQPGGFDHNFCVNGSCGEKEVARVYHPPSGQEMTVFSTKPGVQFYTANFLPEDDQLCGKGGKIYRKNSAFCLETQNYPNAINQNNFPKAYLEVGDVYDHTTRYSFNAKSC